MSSIPVNIPISDKRGLVPPQWLALFAQWNKTSNSFTGSGYVTTEGSIDLNLGLLANRPALTVGSIYLSTDSGETYIGTTGGWLNLSPGLTGDVSKDINSSVTTLASVFPLPGTYGTNSQVPVLTIDEKGRVTGLTLEPVTATVLPSGGTGALQFNNAGVTGGASIFFDTATGGLTFTSPAPTREALSPLTTKGDIFVRNGTASTRLPVGTNGQVLKADNTAATGLAWSETGVINVFFHYGDATPAPICTVPAGKVVLSARITILTAFDDAASTLSLGSSGVTFLTTTENSTSMVGTYTSEPGVQFSLNTDITLTITPGTSTAGYGLVSITLQE